MSSFAMKRVFAIALTLTALTAGCTYHHGHGGYHKGFAQNTPEHVSGGHSRNRPPLNW